MSGMLCKVSLMRSQAEYSAAAAVEKTLVDMRATAKTAWSRTFNSMAPSGV